MSKLPDPDAVAAFVHGLKEKFPELCNPPRPVIPRSAPLRDRMHFKPLVLLSDALRRGVERHDSLAKLHTTQGP